MPRKQAVYVALTSYNRPVYFWVCLVAGHDKARVEQRAQELIATMHSPDTYLGGVWIRNLLSNLQVVSRTRAKRQLGFDLDKFTPRPGSCFEQLTK